MRINKTIVNAIPSQKLPVALISKRMDVYTSGEIVELVAWLKDNRIKYELDIKMGAKTC